MKQTEARYGPRSHAHWQVKNLHRPLHETGRKLERETHGPMAVNDGCTLVFRWWWRQSCYVMLGKPLEAPAKNVSHVSLCVFARSLGRTNVFSLDRRGGVISTEHLRRNPPKHPQWFVLQVLESIYLEVPNYFNQFRWGCQLKLQRGNEMRWPHLCSAERRGNNKSCLAR